MKNLNALVGWIKVGMFVAKKVTISIIKCDVGSLVDNGIVLKSLFDIAEKNLKKSGGMKA